MQQDKKYIVALDQGTTSSRAIVFDRDTNIVSTSQKSFSQIYPQPGWVEHNPIDIWETQIKTLSEALTQAAISNDEIVAIGIANQRETTLVWDKNSGQPMYNAIVWQCRRTAELCENMKQQGLEPYIKETTGLVLDAYFSASKIKWILDNVKGAREKAQRGELLFGTVDTWLIWKLTNGKVHVTDVTNASRTMLFNIHRVQWDNKLLDAFDIPRSMLPEVKSCSEHIGYTDFAGTQIPITGIAGDQQAALIGQQCFSRGMVKNTYGTGCFMLMNTGQVAIPSQHGLLTTIAYKIGGKVTYALEGSVFMGGATIQWLRDELGLIENAADSQYFANKVDDTNGAYLVPAFVGLGAPYWDAYARGALVGLTRGANKNHIIRAALEAIAYQSRDLLNAMQEDAGLKLNQLCVDGGAAANDFLMQFQSDIIDTRIVRPKITESTALGAAYLAGLATGFWDVEELSCKKESDREFKANMSKAQRTRLYQGWQKAVTRSLHWQD